MPSRNPAVRANHHAHFHQRLPDPDSLPGVLSIDKRQGNPFQIFTSVVLGGGGNPNPNHRHRTLLPPNPLPTPPSPARPPPSPPPSPSPPAAVIPKSPVVATSPQPVPSSVLPTIVRTSSPLAHSTSSAGHATSSASVSQDAKSSGANASSHSNSSGVVVGVVLAIVGVMALAAIAWFVRKRKLAKATKMRNSWKAGLGNGWSHDEPNDHTSLMAERATLFTKPLPVVQPTLDEIMPPPKTFNNPLSSYGAVPSATVEEASVGMAQEEETAIVKRGFIPSLPDELPVNIGDMIFIVTNYDDGWCMCRNNSGDKGMVPVECLNRTHQAQLGQGSQVDFGRQDVHHEQSRMLRRESSLYIGVSDGY